MVFNFSAKSFFFAGGDLESVWILYHFDLLLRVSFSLDFFGLSIFMISPLPKTVSDFPCFSYLPHVFRRDREGPLADGQKTSPKRKKTEGF